MGYVGTKREGYVARLKMNYKGGVLWADLGKGWTDEKRAELTQRLIKWLWNDDKPFGIFTVTALQESSTGNSLRLPKVGPERFDKDTPDA
jgi:hypothetical protein